MVEESKIGLSEVDRIEYRNFETEEDL